MHTKTRCAAECMACAGPHPAVLLLCTHPQLLRCTGAVCVLVAHPPWQTVHGGGAGRFRRQLTHAHTHMREQQMQRTATRAPLSKCDLAMQQGGQFNSARACWFIRRRRTSADATHTLRHTAGQPARPRYACARCGGGAQPCCQAAGATRAGPAKHARELLPGCLCSPARRRASPVLGLAGVPAARHQWTALVGAFVRRTSAPAARDNDQAHDKQAAGQCCRCRQPCTPLCKQAVQDAEQMPPGRGGSGQGRPRRQRRHQQQNNIPAYS